MTKMANAQLLIEANRQCNLSHLRMIEEIEDYAIILLDQKGIIQNWNKGAQRIKGYEPEEIIGKNFRVFYTPEDAEKRLPDKLLKQALQRGRASHEGWRVRKDGSRFWGFIVITAIHDENNHVVGFTKVTRDLTERKLAEEEKERLTQYVTRKNEELRQSEQRYHKMVEEVEEYAIILLDENGNIQNWNKGAQKIKGYTRQEIIGKNFRIFYLPEDRSKGLPDKLLNQAVEEGRATHEGWRMRKDGSKFWGSIVITSLHNERGNVIGFTKVTRDLTDRKLAEDEKDRHAEYLLKTNEELRRSEERYHKMVDEVQDYAILLLDKEGNIQNWNAGAEKIKGYRADEIIGKSFKNFYLAADRESGLPDKLLSTASEKGRATHEGWRVRKNGSTFWGSTVITALHDESGSIIGFSKVTRDLTDKKIAEDKLREYAHQLERKNEELQEFAYVASHDLKEPLRKILIFGDLMHQQYGNEPDTKLADYITRIREAAQRLMSLIDDLLQFSRLDNDTEEVELTDLNSIVAAVLADLEPLIHEKKAEVSVGNLPTIRVRPTQLRQLFQNLISNALKFNDKPVPQVWITSESVYQEVPPAGSFCKIVVSDNGIGFSNEYRERIFEIFQRLHRRTDYAGSGIGLAICKRIVEAHNGTIEAHGEEGKGATFVITLPC
ncbi:MAG TPA: PAS domain S-box protein [Chitinophagaceae bacterium]|nr:PAS domain S-box protein [Chitinophagaceae bacterium]